MPRQNLELLANAAVQPAQRLACCATPGRRFHCGPGAILRNRVDALNRTFGSPATETPLWPIAILPDRLAGNLHRSVSAVWPMVYTHCRLVEGRRAAAESIVAHWTARVGSVGPWPRRLRLCNSAAYRRRGMPAVWQRAAPHASQRIGRSLHGHERGRPSAAPGPPWTGRHRLDRPAVRDVAVVQREQRGGRGPWPLIARPASIPLPPARRFRAHGSRSDRSERVAHASEQHADTG